MGYRGPEPVKQPWYAEFGPLFVRLIVGWHLIYGSWGRLASHRELQLFQVYLAQHHFPAPVFCAYLSSIAQVACGYAYLLGLFTRPAAAVMVVNFAVALVMVHRGMAYPRQALALLMLFPSIFLLLHGPGRLAMDNVLRRR
jgi:putative oxidoreductase